MVFLVSASLPAGARQTEGPSTAAIRDLQVHPECANLLVAACFQRFEQPGQDLPELVLQQEGIPNNNTLTGANSHLARIRTVSPWEFLARECPCQKLHQGI